MTTDFDPAPFRDLLDQARAGFLTETAYAVRIAEAVSDLKTHEQNRRDPEQVTADVLRLFHQGANPPEITRIVKVHPARVSGILKEHGLDPSARPSGASRSRSDAREQFPAPRPVRTRFVAPTKKLADAPTKRRPEGIGANQPKISKYADRRCPDDHRHGETLTCYLSHRCRCISCVQANRERNARQKRKEADEN